MQLNSKIAAGLAALISCNFYGNARAETLVYVTASHYGLVDSANPGADITPGGAPIAYTLPNGYFVVGVDVDTEVGAIRFLSRNGSTCQLYTDGQNGVAGLSATDGSYTCPSNTGDIDFADNANDSAVYDYAGAAGAQVIRVVHGNGSSGVTTQLIPVKGINGATANIVGIAFPPPNADGNYGIDASINSLVALVSNVPDAPTLFTESSPISLGVTVSGNTSLDQSDASNLLYMFTAGKLYSIDGSSGKVTSLGAPPAGTIAVVVAQDGFGDSRNTVSTSEGNVVIEASAGQVSATTAETPSFAPSGYDYPLGFFSYTVSNLPPGQVVNITITAPNSFDYSALIKCSSSACRPVGNQVGSNQFTLQLTASASGTIDDPLAPATTPSSGGSSSGSSSSSSGAGSSSSSSSSSGGSSGASSSSSSSSSSSGSSGSSGGSGGGAFAPLMALQLLGLAVLRKRRARKHTH